MTVSEVMELDISSIERMSRSEIAGTVRVLADAANKRIKRLEKNADFSPALDSVKRSGGKFSTKGKTESQLISELQRAKYFMNLKSSTVSGARKVQKSDTTDLGINIDKLSNDDKKLLYDTLRLAKREYVTIGVHKYEWYKARQVIANQLFSGSKQNTPNWALSKVRKWYKDNGVEPTGQKQNYNDWLHGRGQYKVEVNIDEGGEYE